MTRPTLTLTTPATEVEPDGWSCDADGLGWSHDHPSHDDSWPDVTDLAFRPHIGSTIAATIDQRDGPPGFETLARADLYQCTACGAILIYVYPDRPTERTQ
jgi:hypothetical protein